MDWLYLVAVILLAYLIGSIPTGFIIVKQLKGIDIRTVGSGSTGATNVKRVLGTKYYIIVMLLDMFKGLLPILFLKNLDLSLSTIQYNDILTIFAGIALIIGHSKSIFIKFTGGKSVATSVGIFLGLCWPVAVIAFGIWLVIVYLSKYVSLGSIITCLSTPILMYLFDQPTSYIIFCSIASLYVSFYLHRENITRLIKGTENKIDFKGGKA